MSCEDTPPIGCSRRRFVKVAGGSLVVLAACGSTGGGGISVGEITSDDGGTDNPPPPGDMAQAQGEPDLSQSGGPVDLAHAQSTPDMTHPQSTPDMTQTGASCPSGTINAGPASAITTWNSKRLTDNQTYDLHVCRDSGGLFAVDSSCTHAGCPVSEKSSGTSSAYWYCPCHGARFNFDGTHATSPAHSSLANYALCIDGSGNVHVDPNQTVSPATRY